MAKLNYDKLALVALDALLAGGLEIAQHGRDEWYFNGPTGNVGPFDTPEAAMKAAVKTLYTTLADALQMANELQRDIETLRARLDQADHGEGLEPWKRAFDE